MCNDCGRSFGARRGGEAVDCCGCPAGHANNLHWSAMIEAIVLGQGVARHQAVLQALLAAGANTRLTDRKGNTPLALVKARGYGAMVGMLDRAGAK